MKQQGYVNQTEQPIVHKQIDPKKLGLYGGIALLVILMIVFIVMMVNKSKKNRTCNTIEDAYKNAALGYAREKKLLPTVETESVTINGDDLIATGRVSKSDVMLKENQCKATITITRYKEPEDKKGKSEQELDEERYITNVELTNCGYCTTSERYGKWKTSSKMPKGNVIVELVPKFNYYETEDYYTKWTSYYTQDYLSEEKSEYGFPLLENEKLMPQVPDVGHIIDIEKEDKNYYRYRDKKWKFYKNANGNYSAYSSTQPSGYANKDTASMRKTDWSSWSMNYPDTASYRTIKSATGYRWYYKKDGEKIYWNSGEYSPEQPAEMYTERDKKKVTMYSYQDTEWRWYNGERRNYSSYTSVAPRGFHYRDDENTMIGNWSSYSEQSKKTSENSYYREEMLEVRSRYRIKYQVYSLLKLPEFVDKETFEKQVGKPFVQFYNTPNIKVEVEYEYRYRKA